MKFFKVEDPLEKPPVAESVLRSLPDWFSIESSLLEYVAGVPDKPFWAAQDQDGTWAGFLCLQEHYSQSSEIWVCGIRPEFHRQGLGRTLFCLAEAWSRDQGHAWMAVKTLSSRSADPGYARTRTFYQAMGFRECLDMPELWDATNPCVLMMKNLGESAS